MDLWPHQVSGIDDTLTALSLGEKRICLTSPTGGGKTAIMAGLARHFIGQGKKVIIYTNRRLLLEQTAAKMGQAGLLHGIRAAGHAGDESHLLQISSIQTEHSRVMRKQFWDLYEADLALIDEAHVQVGDSAKAILDAHVENNGAYAGFTATPLDLGDTYSTLIQAGNNSELRACGALVPSRHYGPDEPDFKAFKLAAGEDISEKKQRKMMVTPTLFGRVYDWYLRLNPEGRPSLLFAPGVAESAWFAEQFSKAGIPSAHIDGESIWIDGEWHESTQQLRDDILGLSKDGKIKIICNRFVMREGVDCPWLSHGILACVLGSLKSYLQAGGRLLRKAPGKETATIQDHGGHWWRHGSLNEDRKWELGMTANIVSSSREEQMREGHIPQPWRCPQCAGIVKGWKCPCGYELKGNRKTRPVVMVDGSLTEHTGEVYKPRYRTMKNDTVGKWLRMFYRARHSHMTFRQAEALFFVENFYWPPRNLTHMPSPERPSDWFRQVRDVPESRLLK